MSEEGLVEDAGVNAASDDVEQEARRPAPGDDQVRSGGRPEAAEQAQETPAAGDLLGPPSQDGDEPGQELASGEG